MFDPGHADEGLVNLRWGQALIEGLVDSGVREVVASPGSRSTPLLLACLRHPAVRTRILPDERSAAFLALGMVKEGAGPVAVLATSASAPANWYPAVIEAAMGGQALVLISADRPPELQGVGANQTIDQTRLFGEHVRGYLAPPPPAAGEEALDYVRTLARRAVDRARWPWPGPVHVNVALREPLLPAGPIPEGVPKVPPAEATHTPIVAARPEVVADLAARLSDRRGLIVCGPGELGAAAVTRLAEALDSPILADPLSGLRYGRHERARVLSGYDTFLRGPASGALPPPEWVLHLGALPTSKVLQGYLAGLARVERTLVVPHGPWPTPGHAAPEVVHAEPAALCEALLRSGVARAEDGWHSPFDALERRVRGRLADPEGLPLEARVIAQLFATSAEGTRMFCGNSMVIRDVDSFALGGGRPLHLLANRGASGIDGNVSTTLGIACAATGPTVGLLGDLALYHDMNGLLAAREAPAVLVVFNNGGGQIFRYLPQRELPELERAWVTPTGLDPARIAALYGLEHHRVDDAAGFAEALAEGREGAGATLIEVRVEPRESIARHQAFWAAGGQPPENGSE